MELDRHTANTDRRIPAATEAPVEARDGELHREVRVVGTQDVYTVQGEWRGYLVLLNLRTGTTYNESPGRVYDANTGEWLSS